MPKKTTRFECEKCAAQVYQSRITTYPLFLPGRQINIGRVAVKECAACHHLMPTPAGRAKIKRCFGNVLAMFQEAGVDINQPPQKKNTG